MKILATGLSGLVGSRIAELLCHRHEFKNISISQGCDITNKKQVMDIIGEVDCDIVLHLAGKTDVDGCERDKAEDKKILEYSDKEKQEKEWVEKKTAWAVNVLGTQNVSNACRKYGKKIIYISTDFVFDGIKGAVYTEEDMPHPINWYGVTKYEGEQIISSLSSPWMIVRIAYPYRAKFTKNDFVRGIFARLENGQEIKGITDHVFTPTFIDDIAFALRKLIESDSVGLFHVAGGTSLTPHKSAEIIASVFGFDKNLISETTRAQYFQNGAPRPFHLAIENAKIEKLGIQTRSFEEGVREVQKQMENSTPHS